ncbi:MAG: hypothetical protein HY904_07385 [Deltaproteobacteria bacterium]|nr:hypothetical protein [Deltaproteobacteria bacterium]
MEAGPFSAQSYSAGQRTLTIPVTANLTQFQRLIVIVASDPVGAAPTVADARGNTYQQDQAVTNWGRVRLNIFSALQVTPLTAGQAVTVTFGTSPPTAKAAMAAAYNGLLRNPTGVRDRRISNTANNAASISSGTTNNTNYNYELVLQVAALEGTATGVAFNPATTNPTPPAAGGSIATGNGTFASNVGIYFGWSQVTARAGYSSGFTMSPSRSAIATTVTYYGGPSQLVFTAPAGTPSYAASSTACRGPFTAELRNVYGFPVPATANTNVQFSSTSPADFLFTSTTCAGGGTATVTQTYTARTVTARSVYLRDTRRSAPTWTLTATRTLGNQNITAGPKDYIITPAAPANAYVLLPGQTFTEGAAPAGTPSLVLQNVDTAFDLRVTDAFNNQVIGAAGFTGTLPVTFTVTAGLTPRICTVPPCLAAGLTANVAMTDGATAANAVYFRYTGTGNNNRLRATVNVAPNPAGPSSALFNVVTQPTVTLVNSTVYGTKADGGVLLRMQGPGSGSVTQVTVSRPSNSWAWASGAQDSFTGTNPGCVVGAVSNTDVRFDCTPGLATGSTVVLRATNTGSVFPAVAAEAPGGSLSVSYKVGNGAPVLTSVSPLDLLLPLAAPLLPLVVRSAASTRPTFYWTDTSLNAGTPGVPLVPPRDSAGVLVTRGATGPVDTTTYTPPGAGGVTALCSSALQSCVEDASVTVADTAQSYAFNNFDAARIYSQPLTVAMPARPTGTGWFAARSTGSFTLAPPTIRRGTGTNPAIALVPMQNQSLFSIDATGVETQRAVPLSGNVQRRATLATLGTGATRVFLADNTSNGNIYRIDPAGVDAIITRALGRAAGSSVHVALASLLPAATEDFLLVGTNDLANSIRALDPLLAGELWSFALANNESVRADSYLDYTRGWALVPIASGGGGIVGFDVSAGAGTAVPNPPAAWAGNRRLLSGTLFACQPRKIADRYVVGANNAAAVYAIHPDTMASVSFTVEGPVKAVVPSGTNGVIYVTTNGRVGKLTLTATPLALARDTAFTVFQAASGVVGGVVTVNANSALYVSADGRLYRRNLLTGAAVSESVVDGSSLSEPAFDSWDGVLFVGSDSGTFWGLPYF